MDDKRPVETCRRW